MREQFLVEITGQTTNTSTGGQPGRHQVADLIELNRLFTAWVETVYHRQAHSETGAPPLARWQAGTPFPLPTPAALAEAFLWEERRTVTKTATVSLHGNIYQVDPVLTGRRIELIFDPFRPHHRRGPPGRCPGRSGAAASDRPPRPPQGPTPDTPNGTDPDRDRLHPADRRRPPDRTRPGRQLRRPHPPRTPRSTANTHGVLPGQLDLFTGQEVQLTTPTTDNDPDDNEVAS